MNHLSKVAFLSVLILAGCESQPTKPERSPEELRQLMQPYNEKYHYCLGENTAKFIKGADDVQFLVSHLTDLCEPVLTETFNKLVDYGQSQSYARGWTTGMRREGAQITASFILREKSKSASQKN